MAGGGCAGEGDGVGFATESYAASALYTTLANLLGALWRIRRARCAPTGTASRASAGNRFAPLPMVLTPRPLAARRGAHDRLDLEDGALAKHRLPARPRGGRIAA